ncbi:MAG: hypothetical protein K0R66_1702, partial [Gammaproteobacteria bacterium]|nr:hypothetical protein [Gammaproteobacteria bacterium]
ALAAAYAGVSFTDSASNAVSDPSNSLQIPSNIAAPVVTVGVAAFFVLVASALSSSSMPTASRQAQTAERYAYALLGLVSGAITGLAVGALADGTEGAVVPFLGTDTVRYQNYALLGLACAGLGANMSLRLSSAQVSKLTVVMALIAAYAAVSFTDSASNAVSDPSNSLQIPSNIAAPVVTIGVAAFFVLVASALSSSPMQTASSQPQAIVRDGARYEAVGSPAHPRAVARIADAEANAEPAASARALPMADPFAELVGASAAQEPIHHPSFS